MAGCAEAIEDGEGVGEDVGEDGEQQAAACCNVCAARSDGHGHVVERVRQQRPWLEQVPRLVPEAVYVSQVQARGPHLFGALVGVRAAAGGGNEAVGSGGEGGVGEEEEREGAEEPAEVVVQREDRRRREHRRHRARAAGDEAAHEHPPVHVLLEYGDDKADKKDDKEESRAARGRHQLRIRGVLNHEVVRLRKTT